jgi:hypothetical protein
VNFHSTCLAWIQILMMCNCCYKANHQLIAIEADPAVVQVAKQSGVTVAPTIMGRGGMQRQWQ